MERDVQNFTIVFRAFGSVHISNAIAVWESLGFSRLHVGFSIEARKNEKVQSDHNFDSVLLRYRTLLQDFYSCCLAVLFKSVHFMDKAAALYLLYLMYFSQISYPPERIRISPVEWEKMGGLLNLMDRYSMGSDMKLTISLLCHSNAFTFALFSGPIAWRSIARAARQYHHFQMHSVPTMPIVTASTELQRNSLSTSQEATFAPSSSVNTPTLRHYISMDSVANSLSRQIGRFSYLYAACIRGFSSIRNKLLRALKRDELNLPNSVRRTYTSLLESDSHYFLTRTFHFLSASVVLPYYFSCKSIPIPSVKQPASSIFRAFSMENILRMSSTKQERILDTISQEDQSWIIPTSRGVTNLSNQLASDNSKTGVNRSLWIGDDLSAMKKLSGLLKNLSLVSYFSEFQFREKSTSVISHHFLLASKLFNLSVSPPDQSMLDLETLQMPSTQSSTLPRAQVALPISSSSQTFPSHDEKFPIHADPRPFDDVSSREKLREIPGLDVIELGTMTSIDADRLLFSASIMKHLLYSYVLPSGLSFLPMENYTHVKPWYLPPPRNIPRNSLPGQVLHELFFPSYGRTPSISPLVRVDNNDINMSGPIVQRQTSIRHSKRGRRRTGNADIL